MHPRIKRFRAWRLALGVTQTELAEESGVAQTLISRLENGTQAGFTMRTHDRLYQALTRLDNQRRAALENVRPEASRHEH